MRLLFADLQIMRGSGIRLVMKAAEEVHYYSTFNSNNLTVSLKRS